MIGKKGGQIYDDKQCFYAWFETGSVPKAVEKLYRDGVRNRKGGKPPVISVQVASYRYIIREPEEVRDLLKEQNVTIAQNDYLWYKYLVKKAYFVFASSSGNYNAFKVWLDKNELFDFAVQHQLIPERFQII